MMARFRKCGCDYDLCEQHFGALSEAEQSCYKRMEVSEEEAEEPNPFLCEEGGSCYEKSMIRQVRDMLEARGDIVTQVLVQPRKADLAGALRKHFEVNADKVAGLFYIGHGGASGRWELNEQEESFGWDELVEVGFMKLRQGLLILDSCYSAVTAMQAVQACKLKVESGEGTAPALAICAASNKPQKNYSVDWVLDVCPQHRVVASGSPDDHSVCVVVENLKTSHDDYDPFYFFFAETVEEGLYVI